MKIVKSSNKSQKKLDLFFDRELSSLDFNRRVLHLATDESLPVLESLKFLCISSANVDEFFETRVSLLKKKQSLGLPTHNPTQKNPIELLKEISLSAQQLIKEQYQILNQVIVPRLTSVGINILRTKTWSISQKEWLSNYFKQQILPVLSPLSLDPAHPFPRITNKSLNFIVELTGKGAFGKHVTVSIVPVPRVLPRVIKLPTVYDGKAEFILLADLICFFMGELFSSLEIKNIYQFRVTRNSNLFLDEEGLDDLLKRLSFELPTRKYQKAVRIELEASASCEVKRLLLKQFKLSDYDMYLVDGPVNLSRLMSIYEQVDFYAHKFKPFVPKKNKQLMNKDSIFQAISEQEIILHHPYDSFSPVIELLREAALDPNVMVIKQTLYRTASDSLLVDYLVEAARRGKEVVVVVELRAKFDEEANINLANRLQEVGAHVSYGVVGYKTHAKMMMIVRKEYGAIKRYIHLGTGNYHENTAKLYTDFSFFTDDQDIAEDVHQMFLQITGLTKPKKMNKLLHAPFTMRKKFMEHIEQEIINAKNKKPAHIMCKINALTDKDMILAFYKASCAGVKIDLIVRSACSLRPGIKGVSDNIRVISVLGRFLEHSRVYYFLNNKQPLVYLSSADLMLRNLSQRIEIAFLIENKKLKDRIIKEAFWIHLP